MAQEMIETAPRLVAEKASPSGEVLLTRLGWIASSVVVLGGAGYALYARNPSDVLTYSSWIGITLELAAVLLVLVLTVAAAFREGRKGFRQVAAELWILLPLVLIAWMYGVVLYGLGAFLTDAYNAITQTDRPASWQDWRKVALLSTLPLILGGLFFVVRLRTRGIYGLIEVGVAVVIFVNLMIVDPGKQATVAAGLADPKLALGLLTASIYVVVRGLDNIHQWQSGKAPDVVLNVLLKPMRRWWPHIVAALNAPV